MRRHFRFSLATLLLVVTCCALAMGWWCGTSSLRKQLHDAETEKQKLLDELGVQLLPSNESIRKDPITIAVGEVGYFASGYPWFLSVNSARQAQLTTLDLESERSSYITVPIELSHQQFDELREALIREQFFELGHRQGERDFDGRTDTLTITIGNRFKTIEILDRMEWAPSEKAKYQEAARALRVWKVVRSWFQHPMAADLRKYDQMMLDKAEAVIKSQGTVK